MAITIDQLLPEKIHLLLKREGLWNYSVIGPSGLEDEAVLVVRITFGRKKAGQTIELKLPITTIKWSFNWDPKVKHAPYPSNKFLHEDS